MESLTIDMPLGPEYLPGDVADVYLDVLRIGRAIDLAPGQDVHPGHYRGRHYIIPHYGSRPVVGHYEGRHYRDPHYRPRRYATYETDEVYHGLHTAQVRTFDALGNELSGDPPEQSVFVNTGPTPPTGIEYESQNGAIVFAFTESPELAT